MERQFPKNVRQIGNVSDEPKIYVEDYVDTYLKCVGISFIPLVFVNVYRNGIQGMGFGLLPMTAGVAELIGRSVMALIAAWFGSYVGMCFAAPLAWVLAGGLLFVMYLYIMKKRI